MAPHKLEAGDVVQFIEVDRYQQHNVRRCRIVSIEEPDAQKIRASRVFYLDTQVEAPRQWKAARGVHRPYEVYGGKKLDAARAGKCEIVYQPHNGGYVWQGYKEEINV